MPDKTNPFLATIQVVFAAYPQTAQPRASMPVAVPEAAVPVQAVAVPGEAAATSFKGQAAQLVTEFPAADVVPLGQAVHTPAFK